MLQLTKGAINSNPRAAAYAAMAKSQTEVGTKHYYHFPPLDDAMPWPAHHARQHDNPLKECFPWVRWQWTLHDFRIYGLWKALKKNYYMGEQRRRKDERIFCGKDENGVCYYMARRSRGSHQGRWFEAPDSHWFRGQDMHAPPALFHKWLTGNAAHTPAQVKARGEWGHNSRMGIPLPFNIRHRSWHLLAGGIAFMRDPTYIPGAGHIVNPQYKIMEEAGFSKWGVTNKGYPMHMPFAGVHDFSDEVVEEFFRIHSPFGRANKGNDHDEWRA